MLLLRSTVVEVRTFRLEVSKAPHAMLRLWCCAAQVASPCTRRVPGLWSSARRLCACRAAHSGRVEPPDVRKLAQMAQISVTDEEVCLF